MKILIVGYYGFKNLGDELILFKIIEDIRSIDSSVDIFVWSGDEEYTRNTQRVKAVDRFSPEETKEAVAQADVVIVGGGGLMNEYYRIDAGDLFHAYGRHMPSYASVSLLAKIMKKPVFYWGHGVGPFFSREGEEFARWFYTLADVITVRDAYSYRLLKDLLDCDGRHLYLDNDPVLSLDLTRFIKPEKSMFTQGETFVGIQVREWFGINSFLEKLSRVLTRVYLESEDVKFVPVPFNLSSDREILERLMKKMPLGSFWLGGMNLLYTIDDVLSLMSGLDMFMGMRFHAVMCASRLEQPTLCFSYDAKTDEFSRLFHIPYVGIMDVSEEDLYVQLMNFLSSPSKGKLPDLNYISRKIFKNFLEKTMQDQTGKNGNKDGQRNIAYTERYIKGLRLEMEEARERIFRLLEEKERFKEEISDLHSRSEELQLQNEKLQAQNEKLQAQNDTLQSEVSEIHATSFWKVAQWYYTKTEHSLLFNALHNAVEMARSLLRKVIRIVRRPEHISESGVYNRIPGRDIKRDIRDFIDKMEGPLYIIYSGVKYTDMEGQRSVRLTQSFAKQGIFSIYVYHNWGESDREMYGEVEKGVFVISKDEFLDNYQSVMEMISRGIEEKVFLVEMPDAKVIKPLVEANALNFTTAYDILDNWEGFAGEGLAPWYDKDVEFFVLRNTDFRFAVNTTLRDKFEAFDISVISNGFSADKLKENNEADVEKREITAGYFGYLAKGRFDWDLILKTARENDNFMFHIIGYSMPRDVNLPPNVNYVGHLPPSDLSSHVKMWDVCMVPFVKNSLTKGLDPIKIYEYLYFEKPVVVTGSMAHIKGYPYLFFAENEVSSFKEALLKAKSMEINHEVIREFLKGKSWLERSKEMVTHLRGIK